MIVIADASSLRTPADYDTIGGARDPNARLSALVSHVFHKGFHHAFICGVS